MIRLLMTWRELPFHWLLPTTFFCLGLIYLYATPNFEASDTDEHVGMIKWIAENGALPVQSDDHQELYGQEASQPPLYYLLMSLVWSALDTSDFDIYFYENPQATAGNPKLLGNRNTVFYRQPYPPDLYGTSLALYVIRLLTLGMATITVAAVYQSARTVLPDRRSFVILATSLAAFNPMFIFVSTSVSNDVLVTTLASLVNWQMLLMLRRGLDARRTLLLAILLALSSLAKLSGLVMMPIVGLAALWVARRTGDYLSFVRFCVMLVLIWLAFAGWWFARNYFLYGELFGTTSMLDHFGRRSISLPSLLVEEFEGLRISYWGLFGAFSILTNDVYYQLMDVLTGLGVVGLLVYTIRNRRKKQLMAMIGFLGMALALGGAMLIWWAMQTTASTGRLLFPYVTSSSLLLALGLRGWRIPALLVSLPLFVFSLLVPFLYIIPEFDHPPRIAEVPSTAVRAFVRWDEISFVGYEAPPPKRWSPGEAIPITLYWQPLNQSDTSLALFYEFDRRGWQRPGHHCHLPRLGNPADHVLGARGNLPR